MELPTADAVRGDFNNTRIDYFGRSTRFFKDGDAFRVTTDNAEGQPETFTIAYTLGYHPLQQYLVDVGHGRLQALPFAWDTRERKEGGQRWFHLYAKEHVTPENPLFWTRPLQNWNHMCGDCHTTGFRKNFSADAERFDSTWNELGNGCESCHGAGSFHVESRRTKESHRVPNPESRTPNARAEGAQKPGLRALHTQQDQIDQCGACHARRVRIHDTSAEAGLRETMLGTWRPQLPQEGLYFADGQIREEVFEVGSFLQSKMAAKGITCSDCHDPHTAQLKADGNALCLRCHAPETFDTARHYFHQPGTPGAQCVACHMPSRTYMTVDPRRDHRLAVPRPDLSDRLGTPNPCVQCHADRSNAWAAAVIAREVSAKSGAHERPVTLGAAVWPVLHEQSEAAQALRSFIASPANPLLKSAALASMRTPTPEFMSLAKEGLGASEPIVRLGALSAFGALPLPARTPLLVGLTRDPLRAIRLDAAALLVGADRNALTSEQRDGLDAALAEYRESLMRDTDRAESLTGLAALQMADGDIASARASFETALRRDPTSLTALVNFADFRRAQGDEAAGEVLLRRAVALYPESASAHYALGLLHARQKRIPDAVTELGRAVRLAPDDSNYVYVYAVSLYTAGRVDEALATLAGARSRFPANARIGSALVSYCAEKGSAPATSVQSRRICRDIER
jgi:predicted CXXCH cytochrome family protein